MVSVLVDFKPEFHQWKVMTAVSVTVRMKTADLHLYHQVMFLEMNNDNTDNKSSSDSNPDSPASTSATQLLLQGENGKR